MKARLLSLLCVWLTSGADLPAAVEYWVSPDGSDRQAGTKEQPFASVAMAQRKVREARRLTSPDLAGGARIVLRGGTHALTSPLFFRVEDAGTAASPTVVTSAPGERAVLSGGVAVRGWTLAADVAGLPPAARGKVWVADTPRSGGRPLELRQLWVNGAKATRARFPNGSAMSRLAGWDRDHEVATIPAASLGGLRAAAGAEMVIQQQWEIAILRLRALEPAGETVRVRFEQPESAIEFQHPWPQPVLAPKGAGAFFLVNALEFLDEPGEWFADRASGRVYFWPGPADEMARAVVIAPALETLVRVEGTLDRPVTHLRFEDVSFAHTTWLRPGEAGHVPLQAGMHLLEAYKISPPGTPDKKGLENQAWVGRMPAGVVVMAAQGVRFDRCRFEHAAASALDFQLGVRDSAIEGCLFRDIGGNGVQIGSFQEGSVETHVPFLPSDERVVCARVRVANNRLSDTANEDWGCVSILSGYAREIAIEHNEISDTSYTGISVGWGWTRTATVTRDNRVHANRLTRVATRLCDTAGIYTLSAQPGTLISENAVHEITMSPHVDLRDHWFYLYTDEGTSYVTVRDNWCPAEKFLKNANGPGNVWENNGPMMSERVKRDAGLQPAHRDLTKW